MKNKPSPRIRLGLLLWAAGFMASGLVGCQRHEVITPSPTPSEAVGMPAPRASEALPAVAGETAATPTAQTPEPRDEAGTTEPVGGSSQ